MAYTTIDDPTIYFNTKLYAGNGSTNAQTGVGFQPDWVWIKNRSASDHHALYDSVRGANEFLSSSRTNIAETTQSDGLMSFNSDGFTVGADGGVNTNSNNFVAWNWKASGSTATNTDGNVNTTISANTTAGFSIISADPGSTSGELTLGHGLGTVPTMLIWRNRETAGQNWQVFHQATGTALTILNSSAAKNTDVTFWNTHTTTLFKMTTHMYAQNKDFIGYCFSDRKGFSKFGSYLGSGSTSVGGFIHTGFKPAMVILKRTDSAASWLMFDNKRDIDNVVTHRVYANGADAEDSDTGSAIDFLSNGFKNRSTDSSTNATNGTYIYLAFAESPFTNSSGVPNNAR
ncbi:hypothetical protein [uncultured Mediterranean phage uvMED]|nr:hypothetical protein [uncultured Mediterranean phage uvMED]